VRRVSALVVVLTVLLVGACTNGNGGDDAADAPGDERHEPIRYVAVGASETVGFGLANPEQQAWPRVFLRTALPPDTQFTSLGISGSTVATALRQQVPKALALDPTLVTVWLNVNDLAKFVSVETYESQLRDLVHRLRRDGRATVLVANTPALDALPSVARFGINPSLVTNAVATYNTAIERVVREEGAVLVDLHAASQAARSAGAEASFIGPDGFHPSAAGHEAAAAAFAEAYRASLSVSR
jgi:lysophospholipase L1-like esterase